MPPLPSIAFIGRSNVGKSSMINHLLQRKSLVKTSSTPGKTQLLNYFLINQQFYFIDLPGYGFAKVPLQVKKQWQQRIEEFLFQCPELKLIVQLVDARHNPSKEDIQFFQLASQSPTPLLVIANKVDKLKRSQLQKAKKTIKTDLGLKGEPLFHSAQDKTGRDEIWEQLNQSLQLPY